MQYALSVFFLSLIYGVDDHEEEEKKPTGLLRLSLQLRIYFQSYGMD